MSAVRAIFDRIKQEFPAGTRAAGYLLTMTEVTSGAVLTGLGSLDDGFVVISDVAPGTYRSSIALVDESMQPLYAPVEDPAGFVVADTTAIRIAVPINLTIAAYTPPAPPADGGEPAPADAPSDSGGAVIDPASPDPAVNGSLQARRR